MSSYSKFRFLLLLSLGLPFTVSAKQSERYYQEKFAKEIDGQVEVIMKDGTRCDILTATHAIEVDFARKWAEAIGQCLHYSSNTGKKPAVALSVLDQSDHKYISRVKQISSDFNLDIEIYQIDGNDAPKVLPKVHAEGEKKFWITSSGKTHNKKCRYFGMTESGRYSDKPSGQNCKVCGGG
jgi:hypothetical protein